MTDCISFPSEELPVSFAADVVVVGGGSAGCAAAIAAARNGAKTLLLEQSGCCGGMISRGLLPSIIYMTDGKRLMARGICKELVDRAVKDMDFPINYEWQNIHPESVKFTLDEMLREAGVQVLFETTVSRAVMQGDAINALKCVHASGSFAVTGKNFIDTTGDGTLSALAGAQFALGDEEGEVMSPTLCSMIDNIAYPNDSASGIGRREWRQALEANNAPVDEHHFVGFFKNSATGGIGNLGHIYGTRPLDPESRSQAHIQGRELARRYAKFFRERVPGFARSRLVYTADQLGIRESRRILGEYVMTQEDYLARRHFYDDIGSFAYPIDIHASSGQDTARQAETEKKMERTAYPPGENYGIPYRAILVKGITNLLVAGRCLSADRTMQSSIRVVPGCMITGEAAGTAAAMSACSNTLLRALDIKSLQRKLVSNHNFVNAEINSQEN